MTKRPSATSVRAPFEDAGFHVKTAASGDDALRLIDTGRVDIILTDLKMPGMDGLDLLRAILTRDLGVDVVMMTAYATIASAVEATKLGAYDYITKPFSLDSLTALLERILERRELVTENRLLRERARSQNGFSGLIGTSPAMQDLYRFLLKIAPKRCPVLIAGESGTGKELVARAIHSCGPWPQRPFVAVDCGALTPTLVESELFGHVRGAFTGATQDRHGLFRTAADGTIFLDEIGELPLDLQAKLLRVLQEFEFRAVGSDARIPLRARVLAATNRDLEAAIKDRTFRADLYYRLNVVSVDLPPLRSRPEDILPLAQYFIGRHSEGEGRITDIAPAAAERLLHYSWPGNVRELENSVRRALAVAAGPRIELADWPPELRRAQPAAALGGLTLLQQAERRAITEALETAGGHRNNAARMLGIAKSTLYSKLKDYGLDDSA